MNIRSLILSLVFLSVAGYYPAQTSEKSHWQVVVFLSPVCPICQFYALPLRELHSEFGEKGVVFIGLIPGQQFSEEEIDGFREKYEIPFEVRSDREAQHIRLGATITPEVYVLRPDGTVWYSGRIDDSYAAIGKRRRMTSSFDLREALRAALSGGSPSSARTIPIGCLIEK